MEDKRGGCWTTNNRGGVSMATPADGANSMDVTSHQLKIASAFTRQKLICGMA